MAYLDDALDVLKRRFDDAKQDSYRLSTEVFRAQQDLRQLEGRAKQAERFELAMAIAIETLCGEQRRTALTTTEPAKDGA